MVQFESVPRGVDASYMRHAARNPPADPTTTFADRTVLITGANTGLGYEAAVKIARLGVSKLVLGTRTAAKGEDAKERIVTSTSIKESAITVCEVDYGSFNSVSNFVDSVKASHGAIDCAILNAGVAMPQYSASSEGWEMTVQVNALSTILLAIELLPLLRASDDQSPAHLEIVSSIGYVEVKPETVDKLLEDLDARILSVFNDSKHFDPSRQYTISKLILEMAFHGLVQELGGAPGQTSRNKDPIMLTCCPGMCKTDLGRNFSSFLKVIMAAFQLFTARSAEAGSRTLVSGLLQGEEAHDRMWMNDQYDDRAPRLSKEQWDSLQGRVWREVWQVLQSYKPELKLQ